MYTVYCILYIPFLLFLLRLYYTQGGFTSLAMPSRVVVCVVGKNKNKKYEKKIMKELTTYIITSYV